MFGIDDKNPQGQMVRGFENDGTGSNEYFLPKETGA